MGRIGARAGRPPFRNRPHSSLRLLQLVMAVVYGGSAVQGVRHVLQLARMLQQLLLQRWYLLLLVVVTVVVQGSDLRLELLKGGLMQLLLCLRSCGRSSGGSTSCCTGAVAGPQCCRAWRCHRGQTPTNDANVGWWVCRSGGVIHVCCDHGPRLYRMHMALWGNKGAVTGERSNDCTSRCLPVVIEQECCRCGVAALSE